MWEALQIKQWAPGGCYSLMVNVFGKKPVSKFCSITFHDQKPYHLMYLMLSGRQALKDITCQLCQCLKEFNKFLRLDFGLCLSQTSEVNNSISWCISHLHRQKTMMLGTQFHSLFSTMIVGAHPPRNMASPVGRVAIPVVGSGFYQGFFCVPDQASSMWGFA
jgi:hypothetical protein